MSEEVNVDLAYKKNVVLSIAIKIGTALLSLITVNVYLGYLGSVQYGLWLTITSVASWIGMGDLGIGNGLRNELAKAYAAKDTKKQEDLIGNSLNAFVKLSCILFLILSVISEGMFLTGVLERELRVPLYITNFFTCISFVLGIFGTVAHAYQLGYLASGTALGCSLLNVFFVFMIAKLGGNASLVLFAVIMGISGILSNLILFFLLNRKTGLKIAISRNINRKIFKVVTNVGIQFFILQLCGLILYSTDNVIINNLFGGEEVTRYSIITRVYNTGDNLFSILLVSLWSATTYQYSLGNYTWIENKIKQLLLYWLGYSVGVVIVSIGFNRIVQIWLGENAMIYDPRMILVFAVCSIAGMFGSIYVNVCNGIGIIRLQMIMSAIEAVINIPLSVFLAQNMGLGIMGVKIATLICCTGANVVMPVYITRFLKKKIYEQERRKNETGDAI